MYTRYLNTFFSPLMERCSSICLAGGLVLIVWLVFFLHPVAWPQELTVLSPQNGQIFHPGGTITVRVSPPPDFQIQSLSVLGLGIHSDSDPPFEITIPIRADEKIGRAELFIIASDRQGPNLWAGVDVSIEPPLDSRLESLQVDEEKISFPEPGMNRTLIIRGQFSDGVKRDITFSPNTSIASLNEKIAKVEELPQGKFVRAIGPGITIIRIQHGSLTKDVPVSVQVHELQGDLDGDGDVDQDDLNILLAGKNTPATGPGDPRDLDGDGMITALDARKLATLCTRPRCVTQ